VSTPVALRPRDGGVALRIERIDQVTNSPFGVEIAQLDGRGHRLHGTDVVACRKGAVHKVRLMLRLGMENGLPGPRVEHDPWRRGGDR
jgi:hypothetical protein